MSEQHPTKGINISSKWRRLSHLKDTLHNNKLSLSADQGKIFANRQKIQNDQSTAKFSIFQNI